MNFFKLDKNIHYQRISKLQIYMLGIVLYFATIKLQVTGDIKQTQAALEENKDLIESERKRKKFTDIFYLLSCVMMTFDEFTPAEFYNINSEASALSFFITKIHNFMNQANNLNCEFLKNNSSALVHLIEDYKSANKTLPSYEKIDYINFIYEKSKILLTLSDTADKKCYQFITNYFSIVALLKKCYETDLYELGNKIDSLLKNKSENKEADIIKWKEITEQTQNFVEKSNAHLLNLENVIKAFSHEQKMMVGKIYQEIPNINKNLQHTIEFVKSRLNSAKTFSSFTVELGTKLKQLFRNYRYLFTIYAFCIQDLSPQANDYVKKAYSDFEELRKLIDENRRVLLPNSDERDNLMLIVDNIMQLHTFVDNYLIDKPNEFLIDRYHLIKFLCNCDEQQLYEKKIFQTSIINEENIDLSKNKIEQVILPKNANEQVKTQIISTPVKKQPNAAVQNLKTKKLGGRSPTRTVKNYILYICLGVGVVLASVLFILVLVKFFKKRRG